jgi:hypothetical protein
MQRWNGSGPMAAKAGKYEVTAEAPYHQKATTTVTVSAGENSVAALTLLVAATVMDGAGQPAKLGKNNWYYSAAPLYVQPVSGVSLVFNKEKKLQWFLLSANGNAKIEYQIDKDKLTHKLMVGNDVVDQSKSGVSVPVYSGTMALHFQVLEDHVRVTADNGVLLDDCPLHGHDFAHGKFSVKQNQYFSLRDN